MKQLSLRTCKKSLLTSKWTLCSSTFQDGSQSDTLIFQRWKGIPQPRSPPRSRWRNHHESAAVPWSRAGHNPLNHGPLRGPYEALTVVPTSFWIFQMLKNEQCIRGVWHSLCIQRSAWQVSKTADWLRNFYKDACAQRWPLTYCGDWKSSDI